MDGYTDIHCHILPGADDGAPDMDEALRMAEISYSQGIRRIIATPHTDERKRRLSSTETESVFLSLKEEINKRFRDMRFFLGNEIRYASDVKRGLQSEEIYTLAGSRCVLMEFSTIDMFERIYSGLKEMMLLGYVPVLAHAERYDCLRSDMGRLVDIKELGAYIQLNCADIMAGTFDSTGRWTRKMIKEGFCDLIASDSHSSTWRSPVMADAVTKLERLTDKASLQKILFENTEMIFER